MEGCANDYIFIDVRISGNKWLIKEFKNNDYKNGFIKRISNRHLGIGGDGLVLLSNPSNKQAFVKMLMWNTDGSSSKMCGNALRCIALYEYKKNKKKTFLVESEEGLHSANIIENKESNKSLSEKKDVWVEIEMPSPKFKISDIPLAENQISKNNVKVIDHIHKLLQAEIEVPCEKERLSFYILSMGNPHCITFVKDIEKSKVLEVGAFIENHPLFSEKTNVEFVEIRKEGLWIRTFERGSGETQACGSGACAALVASILVKGVSNFQKITLLGGELELEWNGENTTSNTYVYMRGPARICFKGSYKHSF